MVELLNNWLVIYVLVSFGAYYNWMIVQDIKYDVKQYLERRRWAREFAEIKPTVTEETKVVV
jgi:hypothetical protein